MRWPGVHFWKALLLPWREILERLRPGSRVDLLVHKNLCWASILFMFAFVYAKLMVTTPLR